MFNCNQLVSIRIMRAFDAHAGIDWRGTDSTFQNPACWNSNALKAHAVLERLTKWTDRTSNRELAGLFGHAV